MIRLSKVQKELIKHLQNNEIIHYVDGLNAVCFFHNTMKHISWATIFKLEKLDLIERSNKYINLTKAGIEIIIK